ncbi:glutamate receptor 1.2 isoform X1 [Lactuca sativa]|nr:glutamate receptor 1.2 isoform X1 [Lactuca sativa]
MAYCRSLPFLILLMLLSFQSLLTAHEDPSYKDIQVGVILDMDSWVGKVVCSCITMAVSDFYRINPHYTTRITFTTRDTKGEPLLVLSTALDLLENTEVQAIIGPESTAEARFLEVLGDKANIPILSFSTTPFSNQNHNLLRMADDETSQFKGVAAMVELFKAKNVIVICEDTENGREMATYMASEFQEKNIHVTYTSLISTSASKEQVSEELQKLQTMQAMVFVMHTPPSLATGIFSKAKELGMMDEGYMWIITSKTTNLLDSMDAEAIKSMQGAVGFRSYFPASRKLHNFVSKWRKEHYALEPFMEYKEVDSNGIWAYDAVYALAMAIEKVHTTLIGMSSSIHASLLDEMLRVKFHGLGGEFNLMNGRSISKAMEVVNVIGKGGRRVGFWMMMSANGEFVKEIGKQNSTSNHGLESIIWPGGSSATFPKRRILETNGNKKLRILVPDFGTFPNLLQLTVDPKTNISGVSGFCGDVFNAAFSALDYGVGVEIIPYPYKDGMNYNDLIDKIYLKEYDAVIGDITITANRSVYVDFTLPFSDLGTGTIARNAKKNMWIFLDPLSADLWITSGCFFLFLGFVIWFIEHRINEEFQGSTCQQIGTTLWFAFSTLVYAHREKLQSNLSRFVVTVWVFVVLVLTSSYTATLSSVLTVQQIGMKETSTGFLGVSFGGAAFNNMNFGGAKIENLYTPEAYVKALTSGGVDAIIDEILYVKSVLAMYPTSDFSLISTASTTNGFGFAFQKGSPLAGEMSTEIAKMREDGTLKALEDKWLKRQSALMSKDFSSPSPKILNLYGFRGLFLISGVTMAFALLVSMVRIVREKLHVKIKMQVWRHILRRSSEIHAQDSDAESTV